MAADPKTASTTMQTGSEGGEQAPRGNPSQDGAKITLYWLEKSRSQRILWLLEELKLTYDLKTFKRQNMLAPPEFKKIHPLGKSPIVTIASASAGADEQPLVLAESSFVIEYLIEHFGEWLAPEKWKAGMEGKVGGETEGWLRYRYFMHYAEGSLMPFLVMALVMGTIKTSSPFLIKPLTGLITGAVDTKFLAPNLKSNFSFLESQIASSPDNGQFLCGPDLTGADILMSFPLSAARGRAGLTKEAYPRLWAYVELLEGRDGFKRAVEKVVEIEGSYDSSL